MPLLFVVAVCPAPSEMVTLEIALLLLSVTRPEMELVALPSITFPILLPSASVNQTFPSGPDTIPEGPLEDEGSANSVTVPDVVI